MFCQKSISQQFFNDFRRDCLYSRHTFWTYWALKSNPLSVSDFAEIFFFNFGNFISVLRYVVKKIKIFIRFQDILRNLIYGLFRTFAWFLDRRVFFNFFQCFSRIRDIYGSKQNVMEINNIASYSLLLLSSIILKDKHQIAICIMV